MSQFPRQVAQTAKLCEYPGCGGWPALVNVGGKRYCEQHGGEILLAGKKPPTDEASASQPGVLPGSVE